MPYLFTDFRMLRQAVFYSFSQVFFVDATSSQTIQTDLGLIAKAHSVGSSAEQALNWFADHAEGWLLIFDNADDSSLIGQYIPRSSHGNIIVTSRNHEVSHHASPDCLVLLPDLEELDAVDLLLKLARVEDSQGHRTLALDIVKQLGCLALAVSHAGSYISQSCTLREYLPLFRSHCSDLLKRNRVQSPDNYLHTVFSTFELSYLQLGKKAKSFLHVLSHFHHSNIPLQLFPRAAAKAFRKAKPRVACQLLRDFMSYYCDAHHQWQLLLFQDTLEELQRSSIITWNRDTSMISLHPVVHTCAEEVVKKNDTTSHCIALQLLNVTVVKSDNIKDIPLYVMLASHADHLWNYQPVPKIFRNNITIQNKIAYIFRKTGNTMKEHSMWLNVVNIQKRVLGEQHSETWISMNNLATTYYELGHLHAAEQLQKKILDLRIETLGEQHPHTWTSMSDLAFTYQNLGRLHEAEQLAEKVVNLQKATLEEQHPYILISTSILALTYCDLGRFHEAEQLQEKVLNLQREKLGEQHPDTWSSMIELADIYHDHGHLDKAEELVKKVLTLCIENLGEQHPQTWTSMSNLALTYCDLNRLNEAKLLEEKVLSLRRKNLGEQHPDTWTSMSNLATIYYDLDLYHKAEQLEKEVLSLQRETLGEQHPDTWKTIDNLILTYQSLECLSEAKQLGEKVLSLRRKALGGQHCDTWTSMSSLAVMYYNLDCYHEAEQLEKELLSMQRETLGEQHESTLR